MASTVPVMLKHFSIAKILSSVLQAFGILWLAVEVASYFSKGFAEAAKSNWLLFVLAGLAVGITRAWPRLKVAARVDGTDCTISIRVGDMFRVQDANLVVGTNTTFDTTMEDGVISKSSAQGQFTRRLCESVSHLDRELQHSLNDVEHEEVPVELKPYGKRQKYPIGTVATVRSGGRNTYLVAIAHMNEHKAAYSTFRDVADALPRLWQYIRSRGTAGTVCCPVLGSGYSRLDVTTERLVHEIVRSFIPAVREGAFCRSLIIMIHPDDFRDGRVDLSRLGAFLTHECMYGSSAGSSSTAESCPRSEPPVARMGTRPSKAMNRSSGASRSGSRGTGPNKKDLLRAWVAAGGHDLPLPPASFGDLRSKAGMLRKKLLTIAYSLGDEPARDLANRVCSVWPDNPDSFEDGKHAEHVIELVEAIFVDQSSLQKDEHKQDVQQAG